MKGVLVILVFFALSALTAGCEDQFYNNGQTDERLDALEEKVTALEEKLDHISKQLGLDEEADEEEPSQPTPKPTVIPTSTDFAIESWKAISSSQGPVLAISFSATKDLKFTLTDPDSVQIDMGLTKSEDTEVWLRLAGEDETPAGGEYNIQVKSAEWPEQIIDTLIFDFVGADVKVTEVVTSWAKAESESYYNPRDMMISVANLGDLPAYAHQASLTIGEQTGTFYLEGRPAPGNVVILPGKTAIFDIHWLSSIHILQPGSYSFDLTIFDREGQVVATYSGTLTKG